MMHKISCAACASCSFCVFLLALTLLNPAVLDDLATSCDREGFGRNVLGYGRPGGDIGVFADPHRGTELRVCPDECAVFHDSRVFLDAIVIACDDAGADVDVLADRRIAQISKVLGFRTRPQRRFLDLNEVADLHLGAKSGPHAEVRIRTDRNIFTNDTIDDHASFKHGTTRRNFRVRYTAERMDGDVFTDDSAAIDLDRRVNDAIRTDLNFRIDESAGGIYNRHALGHQRFAFPPSHNAVDGSEFLASIDPKDLFG